MRRIIILGLLLFNFSTTFSQQQSSKFSIDITAGASFPVGRFAGTEKSSFETEKPNGLATTGFAINLMPCYYFNKNAHAFMVVGIGVNKQRESSLKDYISQIFNTQGLIEVESESWHIYKLMPGFSYSIRLSGLEKLQLQPQIAAGICLAVAPGFKAQIRDETTGQIQAGLEIKKNTLPVAFAFEPGCMGVYNLRKGFNLSMGVTYFNSVPKEKIQFNPLFPLPGPFVTITKKYNLNTVNAMAVIQLFF